MKITGIICEYNPLHNGHWRQMQTIRQLQGDDSGIVCLMSGNYVQRGTPAVFHKIHRAKAAIECGADLVLELPVTAALSSAEGFAFQGVSILSPFCTHLCFGTETADFEKIQGIAKALNDPAFSDTLRPYLDTGLSFPAARQKALTAMGLDADLLALPNNILAVEYCKAILAQKSQMLPLAIHREGSYHDTAADEKAPSATSLRQLIEKGEDWSRFTPAAAYACFRDAAVHHFSFGERAVLARLRSMTEGEFEQLPFGSEGLWRKLMHAVRECATPEQILSAVKSKRYTHTRIQRMILCAYLGITQSMIDTPAPYVRVLALSERGRHILKQARQHGEFPNLGQPMDHAYQQWENRWSDLYGLFAQLGPENAGTETELRIYCK